MTASCVRSFLSTFPNASKSFAHFGLALTEHCGAVQASSSHTCTCVSTGYGPKGLRHLSVGLLPAAASSGTVGFPGKQRKSWCAEPCRVLPRRKASLRCCLACCLAFSLACCLVCGLGLLLGLRLGLLLGLLLGLALPCHVTALHTRMVWGQNMPPCIVSSRFMDTCC